MVKRQSSWVRRTATVRLIRSCQCWSHGLMTGQKREVISAHSTFQCKRYCHSLGNSYIPHNIHEKIQPLWGTHCGDKALGLLQDGSSFGCHVVGLALHKVMDWRQLLFSKFGMHVVLWFQSQSGTWFHSCEQLVSTLVVRKQWTISIICNVPHSLDSWCKHNVVTTTQCLGRWFTYITSGIDHHSFNISGVNLAISPTVVE